MTIGFGTSLYDPNFGWEDNTNNANMPFLLLNGSGDSIFLDMLSAGTYDRLLPSKTEVIVDNLDHFSIANAFQFGGAGDDDIPSTLSRDDQVGLAAEIIMTYISEIYDNEGICNEMFDEFDGAIVGCQEEHPGLFV